MTFTIDQDEDGKYYFMYIKPGDTGRERNIYSCKGNTIVFRETEDYMGDSVDEPTWYKLVLGKKNIVLYRKFPFDKKYERYSTFPRSTWESNDY